MARRFFETAIRDQHGLVVAALSLIVLIASAYTVAGVGMEMSAFSMTFNDMDDMGAMTKSSMSAMPVDTSMSGTKFLAMFLMWWLMMIAMMLPSATKAILLFATVIKISAPGETLRPTMIFSGGYLLVWAGFSLAAAAAQMGLEASGLISPTKMILVAGPVGALTVIAVAIYQFTPLKRRCLSHCRAPVEFIARHLRPGTFGVLRLGMLHGAYCVGCCMALMALLFVGGVMDLFWIVGLALLVAFEKLGPHGDLFSRATGTLLVAFGVIQLLH